MQRITRERPKIERIACPLPMSRFLDTTPQFRFVAADQDWLLRERPLLFPMASWPVHAQSRRRRVAGRVRQMLDYLYAAPATVAER